MPGTRVGHDEILRLSRKASGPAQVVAGLLLGGWLLVVFLNGMFDGGAERLPERYGHLPFVAYAVFAVALVALAQSIQRPQSVVLALRVALWLVAVGILLLDLLWWVMWTGAS